MASGVLDSAAMSTVKGPKPKVMAWLELVDTMRRGEFFTTAEDVPDGDIGVIGYTDMSQSVDLKVASGVGVVGARHDYCVYSFWVVVPI